MLQVNDRGINLDYLYPDQRAGLAEFFGWFAGLDLEDFTSDRKKARQLAILKRSNFGASVHQMVATKSMAGMTAAGGGGGGVPSSVDESRVAFGGGDDDDEDRQHDGEGREY